VNAAPPPHLRFSSAAGEHLFVTAYSRLFDLPDDAAVAFDVHPGRGDLLDSLGARGDGEAALDSPVFPNPQSISLNVSASCNLACGYCYAGQGAFGGKQAAGMGWEVARAAIDSLLGQADPAHPITIGFIGGEPFVNKALIHRCVGYAARAAAADRLDIRFSVTTNGTLLKHDDILLLRAHPFAVTVSLDGDPETHDRQRPAAGGRSSWARAVDGVRPLLEKPGLAKVAARATVTRGSAPLHRQFDALEAAGFREIGFSPLRTGAQAAGPIEGEAWSRYLDELTALAGRELERLRGGEALRLTNLAVALKQIHRGACSPYPCGAGGGYFSVGSDGDWYACHRAVGEDEFRLGDSSGLDAPRREAFLIERHVHAQTDCTTCWARYLCSGGCHHERARRSRESCDFIRQWLRFCLAAYCELSELHRHLASGEAVPHA
jgi:uncharacterized protein